MDYVFELYLTQKLIIQDQWNNFVKTITNFNGAFRNWELDIVADNNYLRYFLITKTEMPSMLNNLDAFLLKSINKIPFEINKGMGLFSIKSDNNLIDVINYCEVKNKGKFRYLTIEFSVFFKKITPKMSLYLEKHGRIVKYNINLNFPARILAINYDANKRFTYKSAPKYLDISKMLHLLNTDANSSLLKVDTFPYLQGSFFIGQQDFSFDKHSLVMGSSGCGKSKFIDYFIKSLSQKPNMRDNYKVVVIDPHASMEKDIGGLGRVIDFKSPLDSIDLFINDSEDVITSTELMLELFKTLIADQYNSKLERVLRHAFHILLANETFNFSNLRKLLLDLEYRNELLKKSSSKIPHSIISFFMTDFNDLKTQSYGEAISPIIGFIDEMEMIPVFNDQNSMENIQNIVNNNFLTIFSLDRTKLGDKVIKTISGLIMQQMLTYIQRRNSSEHIIFVIDEVPVVESPILCRFLSEARKYNLSLMLAGQYFNQISDALKNSIFANVLNYYIFRISKLDANVLVDNFNMAVPLDNSRERKIKILTELNNRECIARLASNDMLLPAFKSVTLNFDPTPRKYRPTPPIQSIQTKQKNIANDYSSFTFDIGNIDMKDILVSTSSSRKTIKKD